MHKIISKNLQETQELGRELALFIQPGDVICLIGELGTGKTCFSKGLIKGLGVKSGYIGSPTFTIVNEYEGALKVNHFDLYRLKDESELEPLGWEEYFYGKGVTLVEWADKLHKFLPKDRLEIYFSFLKDDKRKIVFKKAGKWRYRRLKKHF